MSAGTYHPALALLLRLKLKGSLRRIWRRVHTLRGFLLTLASVAVIALWGASILIGTVSGGRASTPLDPSVLRKYVQVGALVFTLISVGGAFVHRGLFLPQGEIERLFSAPISRADLVRYRLLVNVGRSLVGGLVFALLICLRMPSTLYGYLGALVAMQLLPVVNQLLAILTGYVEDRAARRLQTIGRVLTVSLGMLAVAIAVTISTGRHLSDLPVLGPALRQLQEGAGGRSWVDLPLVRVVTAPFEPWARLLTATDAFDFLTWLGVCAGIWLFLFELTARLPIDFRELSLETAASVAKRLRRARRGGGASASRVSQRAARRRLPWVFGRGPAGAVVWRKSITILRKARGTLWISTLVVAFVTLLSSMLDEGSRNALATTAVIAVLGTLYLCAGLRFDFREDLDRMESMCAWPIAAPRLFLATILPQVVLVSFLVLGAIGLHAFAVQSFQVLMLAIAAFVPPFALAWIALDNAVFLFLPVRIVPGQEGVLANAGRGVLVLFMRMALLAVVVGIGAGFGALAMLFAKRFADSAEAVAWTAAGCAAWGALVLVDGLLVAFGGWLIARFDVARDRG